MAAAEQRRGMLWLPDPAATAEAIARRSAEAAAAEIAAAMGIKETKLEAAESRAQRELAALAVARRKVRGTSHQPRSRAILSHAQLCSHRNAWADSHLLGRPDNRVRSHCRFRERGTESLSESGMKWTNGRASRRFATEPYLTPLLAGGGGGRDGGRGNRGAGAGRGRGGRGAGLARAQ